MNTIEGLTLIENFITKEEEEQLLTYIKQNEWSNALKRRVQHYGYEYNYENRDVGNPIEAIPNWTEFLMTRMIEKKIITKPFEQLIINEYTPGQGISKHTDAKIFGNTIVSLSLGSPCNMIFRRSTIDANIEINLQPTTLLIMKNDARWKWTHEIPSRKSDNNINRTTRISMTFRYLYDSDPPLNKPSPKFKLKAI